MSKTKNGRTGSVLLIFMIILGRVSSVFALDPKKTITQYSQDVWLRQSGLPTNTVNVVHQTRDGYLWLGTTVGLFRFDGDHFEWISTNPLDSKNREAVSSLYEAPDGNLWIGTAYYQLRCLKDGKIVHYGDQDGIQSRNINVVFVSRNGDLWLGASYGLYKFKDGKFIFIQINPTYITAITEDALGRIWVGTHSGIRILEGENETEQLRINSGSHNEMVTTLYADNTGNIWIGTYDGLIKWKDGVLTSYSVADGLSDYQITALFKDRDGNLWVGTNKGGINRLADGKWSHFTVTEGLSNNHVLSIAEDREGSIWVGTMDGLNRFKNINITPYTSKEGFASDFITSIVETPDQTMYFFSSENSTITKLKDGKISILSTSVGPVYVARDSSLWIGQNGLLINIKGNQVKRFDTKTGLPPKWISAITEDKNGLILYVNDIGIRRFVNGQLKPYLLTDGSEYSSHEYVSCFYSQPEGVLWIGTSGRLVKIQNGKSKAYGPADGIAENWINTICDDHRGSLWIGSPYGGLTRYQNGKFTAYTNQIGLFTDEIYCVLCDDQGNLWMSSPRGIGRVLRRELDDYEAGRIKAIHCQVYTAADGMKTDECFGEWQPAGWKAHDGRLWFATKKGAVMVDPKALKRNKLPPPVLIERIGVDQKTVPINQTDISLAAGTEKFEFHYTALSFFAPERVLFKYQLEGFDHNWVEAGTRRVAYYTNLPPGSYKFRVMACNNDGVWNETGASFSFRLKPHFYETYWFYGLLIIALSGTAIAFYRIRVWQLVKREKELQIRIQEALANIKTLGGLIPICASCKKIRDDKGYWDQLEGYIQSHSDAKFSHGLCPDCAHKLYPELFSEKEDCE